MGRYTVNGTSYDSWEEVPPAAREALRAVGAGPRDEVTSSPPAETTGGTGANRYHWLPWVLAALILALAVIAALTLA